MAFLPAPALPGWRAGAPYPGQSDTISLRDDGDHRRQDRRYMAKVELWEW
jgi:hypothetical protein